MVLGSTQTSYFNNMSDARTCEVAATQEQFEGSERMHGGGGGSARNISDSRYDNVLRILYFSLPNNIRPNYVHWLTQTLSLAVKILGTSARISAFSSHTVNSEFVARLKRISSIQVSYILFRVCFKLIDFVFHVRLSSFLKCLFLKN